MPTRLNDRGANLVTDHVTDDVPDPCDWNNIQEGVDRQAYAALKYVGGDGVILGGLVLDTKRVGPTRCIVGGWCATTVDNQLIEGLVDGKLNKVWAVRCDVPTTGPYEYDPCYDTTFNAGIVRFLAQDAQPANSFYLGSITLDGASVVTDVDNEDLDRPEVLPGAVQTWTGSVAIAGLAEDTERWVDVPHSGDVTYRAKVLFDFTNPKPAVEGGFEIICIENCRPELSRMLIKNVGSGGDPYYGDESVTIYVAITGVPE